jgi:hypothetical protein
MQLCRPCPVNVLFSKAKTHKLQAFLHLQILQSLFDNLVSHPGVLIHCVDAGTC